MHLVESRQSRPPEVRGIPIGARCKSSANFGQQRPKDKKLRESCLQLAPFAPGGGIMPSLWAENARESGILLP
jgi:hypothetical protein